MSSLSILKRLLILLCSVALFFIIGCRTKDEQAVVAMQRIMESYAVNYDTLGILPVTLSFTTNLQNILPKEELDEQERFFHDYQKQLSKIDSETLTDELIREYDLLNLEIELNLERIDLERKHINEYTTRKISDESLYFVPNGKEWYRYFLKRWLIADVTPEQIMEFGMEEIKKVQQDIQELQQELGFRTDSLAFYEHLNENLFFEKRPYKIESLFETRQAIIKKHLESLFYQTDCPPPNIEQGDNQALSQVPAYYNPDASTFYYNIFKQPFNKRLIDLLYLHEAIPGHHYQFFISKSYEDSIPKYYKHLNRSVYWEGWAAYVEELGEDLGLYRTLYDWMGKHEWNLVRSVRVVMDVGINYLGWSDEKALSFWKTHIENQDDIAMREIDRMKRWPVQVITYKYGSTKILEEKAAAIQNGDFDIKAFHSKILKRGLL